MIKSSRFSHVLSESKDAALPAPAVIVAPTLAPGSDGVLQDHELTVALVVNADHLPHRGLSARTGHDGGVIVTKQNLECLECYLKLMK